MKALVGSNDHLAKLGKHSARVFVPDTNQEDREAKSVTLCALPFRGFCATHLVVTVAGVLLERRLADGEQERLTARHAHDVFSSLVDLLLRLGFAACRFGVALALLLCSVL